MEAELVMLNMPKPKEERKPARPAGFWAGCSFFPDEDNTKDLLESLDLPDEDKRLIRERGYVLKKVIGDGEGGTRDVYRAIQKIGNLEREVALKIPRADSAVNGSPNTQINLSKRDIDLQEALISGQVSHPNIVRMADSFHLSDGRTVNAEDYVEGMSLSTFVQRHGKLTEESEKIKKVFTPLISAVHYLHSRGILHRDITSRNVLLPNSGDSAILTDLQNAEFSRDIKDLVLPTRGGTAYAHPDLINAVFSEKPTRANHRTDIYSLSAVLYELVTGEKAFNYQLVENANGKPVFLGKREIRVRLKDGNKDLEAITVEDHEARLKESLKKVPRSLRRLLYDGLSLKSKTQITDIYSFESRFEEATREIGKKVLSQIGRYAKIAMISAALGFGGLLGISATFLANNSHHERTPTLSDIMHSQFRINQNAKGYGYSEMDMDIIKDDFQKYVEDARLRMPGLDIDFSGEAEMNNRCRVIVDKRLTSALLRSIYLEEGLGKIANANRFGSYVPISFLKDYLSRDSASIVSGEVARVSLDPRMQRFWMARYIQSRYNPGDTLEEVYAKAMCDREEIDSAKGKTQRDYLLKELRDKKMDGGPIQLVAIKDVIGIELIEPRYFARAETNKSHSVQYVPGYAPRLPEVKRRIIDRAVALWLITDEEGKIDFTRYSMAYNAKPVKGEEAK